MESPNTSPQAVELDPSGSGQAHSNRTGTGLGYENMEPGCILTVLRVPPVIRLEARMRSPARLLKRFHAAVTNGRLDLGEHLRTHLKYHTRYDHGLYIHGNSRIVLLLVGEAQLTGCLKVWVRGSGTQASSESMCARRHSRHCQ